MAKKNREEAKIQVAAKIVPTVTTTILEDVLNEDMNEGIVFEKDVIKIVTPAGSNEVIDYADRDTAIITIVVNTSFSFTSLENGAVKFLVITKQAANTISFAGSTDTSARKTFINTTPTLVVYRVSNKNGAIYVESINIDNDISSGKEERFSLQIGVWNMDLTFIADVSYTPPAGKVIVSISATIINDSGNRNYLIWHSDETDPEPAGTIYHNGTTNDFHLDRFLGKFFDSTSFSDAVMNRGHITFGLIDE